MINVIIKSHMFLKVTICMLFLCVALLCSSQTEVKTLKDTIKSFNLSLFQAPIEKYSVDDLMNKYGKPDSDEIFTAGKSEGDTEIIFLVENKLYKNDNVLRNLCFKIDVNTILNITYLLDSNTWLCGGFYLNREILTEDTLFRKQYLYYSFEQIIGFLGEPVFDSMRDSVYLTNEKLPEFLYDACGRVTGKLRRTAWKIGDEYILISFAECYDCIWRPYNYYIGDKIIQRNF